MKQPTKPQWFSPCAKEEGSRKASLFPMFVKLDGCKCLVVGGGSVAESKIRSLLACGALVHVVAPSITKIIEAWVRTKRITWASRTFHSADLEGMTLVVAATSSEAVNNQVFRAADARKILCNAVDDPERCHFYYGAVVRRGALQIAISTAGLSPALARRLRRDLEFQFGPEYGEWLEWLGAVREMLFALNLGAADRKRVLHRLASRRVFDRFRQRRQTAREVSA
jgi:precorrin-2 dehydrogenase/sirohydrochlorin ferrochelatase